VIVSPRDTSSPITTGRGGRRDRSGFHRRQEIESQSRRSDPETDIAVLQVEGGVVPRSLSATDALRVGDVVLAIGNPFGVGQTVTMGIVSALAATSSASTRSRTFIQTRRNQSGKLGGALIDTREICRHQHRDLLALGGSLASVSRSRRRAPSKSWSKSSRPARHARWIGVEARRSLRKWESPSAWAPLPGTDRGRASRRARRTGRAEARRCPDRDRGKPVKDPNSMLNWWRHSSRGSCFGPAARDNKTWTCRSPSANARRSNVARR